MSESDTVFDPISYRPQAYYYRTALREARSVSEARRIGYMLCDEVEHLKEQVRECGMIPGRAHLLEHIMPDDARQRYLFDLESVGPDASQA
ncbi:MAG: hypothetical protein Q7Q73_03375 [Verrucomicrobiota bacterium JB024]|nr:hypothetical protein [Verrucomicrobiota bacterium JB024]